MQLIALAADEPQPSVRDMGIMIELKKNTEVGRFFHFLSKSLCLWYVSKRFKIEK